MASQSASRIASQMASRMTRLPAGKKAGQMASKLAGKLRRSVTFARMRIPYQPKSIFGKTNPIWLIVLSQ